VASAVELLKANRIGHGLRASEDPAVMALLAERGVALEMCPTSNYQTGCVDDLQAHPLPALDRAGVAVTLNADDPAIHRTTLNDDYDTAITRWGYGLDDLLRLERNAVEAAFLPGPEKEDLRDLVEKGYDKSRQQGLL
jgi:adenosine deaminase